MRLPPRLRWRPSDSRGSLPAPHSATDCSLCGRRTADARVSIPRSWSEARQGAPMHASTKAYVDGSTTEFVQRAVERSGARVLASSPPDEAPLFLGMEDDRGERMGLRVCVPCEPTRDPQPTSRRAPRPDPLRRCQRRVMALGRSPLGFDPLSVDVTLVLGVTSSTTFYRTRPLIYSRYRSASRSSSRTPRSRRRCGQAGMSGSETTSRGSAEALHGPSLASRQSSRSVPSGSSTSCASSGRPRV